MIFRPLDVTAALLIGTLFGATPQAALGQTETPDRPNIVVIFADDLGYGDLSCYGQEDWETPNIDRMAAEGVRFTDFYVPVPYCAPSRATLLTGRYPFRNGVMTNPSPDNGKNRVGLPLEETTLAEALSDRGYTSICIGKWHLGHIPKYLPRKQGFDEYFGIPYSNDMRPVQLVHNEEVVEYPVVQGQLTKRYTERAIDFIEENRDDPFFLYLPHAMPHKPLAASERFYTPETPDDLYADVIRELDWSVGRILETLKEQGLEEETLVIFASDNGPWYGGSTGGLRGMKSRTWDGGVRVPMIARWPGQIPGGQVCERVVASADIFPTVCKLAGAELPEDRAIDGENIFPLMQDADTAGPDRPVYSMRGRRLTTVRHGKWKLHVRSSGGVPNRGDDWVDPRRPDGLTIIAPSEQARPSEYPGVRGGDGPGRMLLFNLEKDPAEQNDVSDQHPQVVERLKQFHDEIEAERPEFEPVPRDWQGMKRLTGGELRYDRVIEPVQPAEE
jgi:uncharacterized sulfatase